MEDNKTVSVAEVVAQPIGQEQLRQANLTLQKYKEGKANLEQRVIDNEEWYRLRHWECMRGKKKQQVEPVSAFLAASMRAKMRSFMGDTENSARQSALNREGLRWTSAAMRATVHGSSRRPSSAARNPVSTARTSRMGSMAAASI